MKILHVNSYYSSSAFYKNLYDEQCKKGLNISVFVPVPKSYNSANFGFGDYTIISGNHNKWDRVIFHLKHNKILKDIERRYSINDYEVIHAHSLFSNGYIAMKLKKKYGIPYVVAVRNTDINVFFKKMLHLRRLGIEILSHASKIVFISKNYEEELFQKYIPEKFKKSFLEKSSIIPNGLADFWHNHLGRAKELGDKSEIKLLFVGMINKNKNIATTIKAIKLLRENDGHPVTLTVVGEMKSEELRILIESKKFIEYLGKKNKEELLEIYREHHIFVMPSITETFGLVYLEAMSQGLPVLYSKKQGFDGYFENGKVGYAVESLSPEDIAEKILLTIKNYKEISDNCLNSVTNFNWSNIERAYYELYNK